ncbi:MAG: MerR family transcriptional regulator [Candidatus Aminicenantes bacterium]|nr:MerR family transcriptional regulator [Candidatus Aminicenantes bacterium]
MRNLFTLTSDYIHANLRLIFTDFYEKEEVEELEDNLIKEKKEEAASLKSEKLVYRLDEISRLAKVAERTIDSWEKEFYFVHAGVTASGERIFRKKDLEIIIRLKELLENQGLTLAGAKRRIEEEFSLKTPVSVHPDRLKKVLFQVREQLKEIASSLNTD